MARGVLVRHMGLDDSDSGQVVGKSDIPLPLLHEPVVCLACCCNYGGLVPAVYRIGLGCSVKRC